MAKEIRLFMCCSSSISVFSQLHFQTVAHHELTPSQGKPVADAYDTPVQDGATRRMRRQWVARQAARRPSNVAPEVGRSITHRQSPHLGPIEALAGHARKQNLQPTRLPCEPAPRVIRSIYPRGAAPSGGQHHIRQASRGLANHCRSSSEIVRCSPNPTLSPFLMIRLR